MKKICIAVIIMIAAMCVFLNLGGCAKPSQSVIKADIAETNSSTNTPTPSPIPTPSPAPSDDDIIVYRGKSGTKYHNQTCYTLREGAYPIKKSEALEEGRKPCYHCSPNKK